VELRMVLERDDASHAEVKGAQRQIDAFLKSPEAVSRRSADASWLMGKAFRPLRTRIPKLIRG
jgi:hypothetical protein